MEEQERGRIMEVSLEIHLPRKGEGEAPHGQGDEAK
jgi:hypothetical protein